MFIGRTDAKAETPILWPPHAKSWLIGKDPDAGRDRGQEEKGMTEDKMAGWHHRLNGHESEWTPGVGDGQGGLACCDSWGLKESDTTERLNWIELSLLIISSRIISSVLYLKRYGYTQDHLGFLLCYLLRVLCVCVLHVDLWSILGTSRWCSGKESTCQCRRLKRCGFDLWVGKIPLRRKWQPTVLSPGKSHAQRSLVGYSLWGCKRVRYDWAHTHTHTHDPFWVYFGKVL